jgi:inhibitor of cysteine peptidase
MRLPVFAVYLDKRKLVSYTVLAFVLGSLLGGAMWNFGGIYTPEFPPIPAVYGSLRRFTSQEEMSDFLKTRSTSGWAVVYVEGRGFSKIGDSMFTIQPATGAAGHQVYSDSLGSDDFSGTNIQVEGVDEADMVKTDGEYIYLASSKKVYIVRAYPPSEAELVSTLEFDDWVLDLFINEDKLVVFLCREVPQVLEIDEITREIRNEAVTEVMIYDVSDRSQPTLDRNVTAFGFYQNSRMIDDYVYVITQQSSFLYGENDTEVWLPRFTSKAYDCEVEPTQIYYVNNTDSRYSYTNIVAINVQDPDEKIVHESFLLSSTSNLYASTTSIYLTSPHWLEEEDAVWEATRVYKIAIDGSSIVYAAEGLVPGRILNQFSMDEYDGHFRIATTVGHVSRSGGDSRNNVYVLNSTMATVGRLEDLAPGEKIYSARFMGRRCYLVTFKKIDPLFTIDLSDPEDPSVLGKLKIPGYSDYLHPYDEDHLIGIGKETVEAEEGDFAWYQGVKVSLFDVSDVENPRELAKFEIGDRGTDSPALHDHKAFLFSRSKNLLVIPVLVAEIDEGDYSGPVPDNAHGEYVFQGAYVFDISPEDGISLRGRVTHIEDDEAFLKSGYWFDSTLMVERSLYISDMLYTISEGMVKINSLGELSEVGSVELS